MDLRLCLFLLATTVAKPQENISPECSLETDGFCDDGHEQAFESVELDQTIPKILLVGPTGSGKSSMANSLLGIDPETENAMFPVCMDMDSCTKETTYATGKWLGYGDRFIVVDTPGLQDSNMQDNDLIREMIDVLKNKVKTVDCIVLLIEGTTERFHSGLTSQLTQFRTKWEYDEKSISKREKKCRPGKKSCKDENWFKRNILKQLEQNFHQTKPFNFAFIHSYSQIEDNKDDESEQKHWKEETDKLWSFVTSKNSSFALKDVDDILQDNRRLKRQVDELENTIDTEIADLKSEIQMIKDTHDSELNQLKNKTLGEIQTIKETHNSELNQLKDNTLGEIQTIKDTHDSELNQLKDNTLVNKEELTQTINTNKQELSNTMQNNKQELTTKIQNTIDTDISKIKGDILNLSLTPVGTVIGWLGGKYLPFPSGWQKCDGTIIWSGPMKGRNTQVLNVGGYFLRGALTTDTWTIQEDMIGQHGHNIYDPGHSHTDKGHSHGYYDKYSSGISEHDSYPRRNARDNNRENEYRTTDTSRANIQSAYTSINVNDVNGATAGVETRPKNIAVEWIIKIV